ncbi:MAG: flagellar basal body rod protein FlgB [Lachnospiraceae bacterium]|nr:flagellar basal body rod protein FlgB [Lachnospiraceae bacterium]
MFDTGAFNYINVLDKAADASWIRNEAISNNIANVDTPGYKRQDVNFEEQLRKAMKNSRYTSIDERVANVDLERLNPITYRDHSTLSYRLDGNNVDIDTENVELASNQIRYQGLTDSITKHFQGLQSVMK